MSDKGSSLMFLHPLALLIAEAERLKLGERALPPTADILSPAAPPASTVADTPPLPAVDRTPVDPPSRILFCSLCHNPLYCDYVSNTYCCHKICFACLPKLSGTCPVASCKKQYYPVD
ncbi:hypothetical protein Pelo_5103 [Pelomyxa schiedti]|nr:hypothetical protein Pelo_5103 [Pelomyxa schiedti]